MRLESWSRSDVGLVRKSNQDSLGCFPEAGLFVVADGMGGRSEGEVASRIAVDTLRELMAGAGSSGSDGASPPAPERPSFWRVLFGLAPRPTAAPPPPTVDLRAAVLRANQRVFEEGKTRPEAPRGSMGTTIVVLRCGLDRAHADWAHVGDSRLYRVRGGELELLTADHTLYGEAYRGEDEIPSDLPHTNRLVRAIGIRPEVEVSKGTDVLHDGDLFLLCSDGISGMISVGDLEMEMTSGRDLDQIGEALIRRALDAGGKDNASALLVKVRDATVA
jgi:protein phosphatase